MATISAYRNGATAGMAGHNATPPPRGNITGWTAAAVRRHTAWLYSIDAPRLDGVGVAVTLTMQRTPDTGEDWQRLRKAWIERARRLGATRLHWVVEWQRRGTPHLHCAVYAPEGVEARDFAESLLVGWIGTAAGYGPQITGQHWNTITGPLGWLKYLSKHASRGVRHYQRWGHPDGWAKTGRLWGHSGEWPADAPMKFEVAAGTYHRYRRLVRSWRVANARAAGDPARIRYARRMLACPDPRLSAVRGVSDWVPEDVALGFLALLESEGRAVVQS